MTGPYHGSAEATAANRSIGRTEKTLIRAGQSLVQIILKMISLPQCYTMWRIFS